MNTALKGLWLKQCSSTNDEARTCCLQGNPPLYVGCDQQTAGRGRAGRSWMSGPGTLCVTYILQSTLPLARYGMIALAAGIAVCKTAREYRRDAVLKWPNDVICPEGKLAGLLCETVYTSQTALPHDGSPVLRSKAPYLLLGIGLNLRSPEGGFPKDIPGAALNCGLSLQKMASQLLNPINQAIATLEHDSNETIRDWVALGPSIGTPIMRRDEHYHILKGRYAGLGSDGSLLLQTDAGYEHIYAGDVFMLS